jgi:hypothetical protein
MPGIRKILTSHRLAHAVLAAAALAWPMQVLAENATLKVINNTSSYITVSVDGNYGCNTAPHTTCTIPVTTGFHRLRAVATDSGAVVEMPANISPDGYTWTIVGQ